MTAVVRGFWTLDAAMGRLSDPVASLYVAPVGEHPVDATRLRPRRVDDLLAGALGLDPASAYWPGDDHASGLEWIEVAGVPRARPQPWGRPDAPAPRALLVADRPCRRPYGARALQGPAGGRLAQLLGVGLDVVLGTFETCNAGPAPEDPGLVAARARGRHVVFVGDAALAALATEAGVPCDPPADRARGTTAAVLGAIARRVGARSARAVPHPSGSTALNTAQARIPVSATLLAAALAARGLPHLQDPWEAAAAEASERYAAGAPPGSDPRVVLRHLAVAWACLGRAGVAWEGSRPCAGWRRVEAGAWVREWAGSAVEVVPGLRGWLARVHSPCGSVFEAAARDEDGALLFASELAGELLGPGNWERRTAALAAVSGDRRAA